MRKSIRQQIEREKIRKAKKVEKSVYIQHKKERKKKKNKLAFCEQKCYKIK